MFGRCKEKKTTKDFMRRLTSCWNKMMPQQKQYIVEKMIFPNLVPQETVEYLNVLSNFSNLFIPSYERIRDLHDEDLHIELKGSS